MTVKWRSGHFQGYILDSEVVIRTLLGIHRTQGRHFQQYINYNDRDSIVQANALLIPNLKMIKH